MIDHNFCDNIQCLWIDSCERYDPCKSNIELGDDNGDNCNLYKPKANCNCKFCDNLDFKADDVNGLKILKSYCRVTGREVKQYISCVFFAPLKYKVERK